MVAAPAFLKNGKEDGMKKRIFLILILTFLPSACFAESIRAGNEQGRLRLPAHVKDLQRRFKGIWGNKIRSARGV